jgi:hypothetical protein
LVAPNPILENGLATRTPATVARVRDLISFLSTIAGTSYLDLVRPTTDPPGDQVTRSPV